MAGSPSKIVSPVGAPVQTVRGTSQAVIASVDNASKPTLATIYVQNQYPSESLYKIDSSFAPFGPGGSAGFKYFYNNAQNLGGSIVTVDLDRKVILGFTGSVSTAPPVARFTQVSTRQHVGSLDPPLISIPGPIQINSINSLVGNFPYYLSSLNTITPILSSGNIIASGFPSMSLSGGLYTQTAANSVSTVGIVMPVNSWLFTDWVSENISGGDWGPVISDGTNTYQFNMSSATGNISLFRNGVDIYDVTLDVSSSVLHSIVFAISYVGGTTWRLKAWIDGTEYIDFTDSSSLNPNHIYPAFKCVANQVKHLDADFYGSCTNPLKLDNPSPTTAPVISAVTISYPLSISSGNYYAQVAFTVGGDPQPWMEGMRVKDGVGGYVDVAQTSNNQYVALMELNATRTISAAFLDLAGAASTFTTVGTATYPGVVTGSAGSGAAPVALQGATEFSYVENFGTTTFDAVANIYLDSNGTTSNTTLAFIELVSAPTGTTSYTVVGTLAVNASGNYQAIWNDLVNANTYDLGVRYVDTQGARGAVYTIGTTAQPPIFVIPQPIPTGIPVAPVIQGGSVSLGALVSQVDNNAIAGSLQDIIAKLKVTNVPQDYSVNRLLWSFRKYLATSLPPGSPSIVKAVTLGTSSIGGVNVSYNNWLAQFDNSGSYTPTVGNFICIVGGSYGTRGTTSPPGSLGAGWTLLELNPPNYPSNHDYIYVLYKFWTGSDTVGEVAMNSANGALEYTIYEVANVNTGNPISQFAVASSLAASPVTTPPITPAVLNALPIYVVQQLGSIPSSPTTPPVWSGATLDGYSYIVGAVSTPSFLTTAHGGLTADTITPVSGTVTMEAAYSSVTWDSITFLINPAEPPTSYSWTDYNYTNLEGLPLPPETQPAQTTYGQLAVGIPYDFSIQYVSVDNVLSPRTIFQSNYTSPIKLNFPGTVSTANAVADSGFTKTLWGQNNAGSIAANKSGINLNWKFYNIDGVNEGGIVKGSITSGGTNYLFIPPAGSGITFRAISEPITVAQAQAWMAQGYIDARTCSGGTTGGAYIAIVDNSGTNTFTTTYAKKAIAGGTNKTLSLDSAWTVPPGVTEVCFMFHSDEMTISSSGLFFCNPMMENNTIATGYTLGPPDASDGSTRSAQSVTQSLVLNNGYDASTISTSPVVSAGAIPTSGGGAPTSDKLPQGSVRTASNGAVYIQTSATSSSPAWELTNVYGNGTAISISGTWPNQTISVTTVPVSNGGTNTTSYTLGDLLYASGSTTLTKLAGNITTSREFLRQTGTGSVSAAPAWDTLIAGDIPSLDASKITTGEVALSRGGTNADLSATGGASQVLQQSTLGGAITVGTLASTNLSDVSSGTWTPVLAGQTTAGTQTYSSQVGTYVVIGNLVYISCSIVLTAFDGATAGNINITGLPFTISSGGPAQYIANAYFAFVTLDAGYTQFVGTFGAGNTRISLVEIGSNIVQKRLQPGNINNGSNIALTGWYQK